ncbi:unnamed protein product [Sphagnum compactum]
MAEKTRNPPASQKIEISEYQKKNLSAHSKFTMYASMAVFILLCPVFVICLWHTAVNLDGSVANMWKFLRENGLRGILEIWPVPSLYAFKLIVCYSMFEALLQLFVPGEEHIGPVSPTGNHPVYKNNGLACYLITILFYYYLYKEKYFNPALVYDHLGEILSTLVITSFFFCCFLYMKGHIIPSSSDWGSSGNILVDFYWGMELYPRIGKDFDIKVFTNCRFGMMSWAVLIISFCVKQVELYGKLSDSLLVSVVLMLVYITKFFWWESGYWNSMDIAHDRAGFYIVWGCLVWLPSVYTSPALYLVDHPVQLGNALAAAILVAGLLCIWINYDCDCQRQQFRKSNGKDKVWGRTPEMIEAQYVTEAGERKQSLLLISGWWGLARHFHYAPEIAASFLWSVPALFTHAFPYFYVFYLTLLLVDRAERDDKRCQLKYNTYWEKYKKRVPYKILPHIY